MTVSLAPFSSVSGSLDAPRRFFFAKRCFDLAIVLTILPVAFVVALACALAIRIETPGSPIFWQHRTGQHGRRFRMYKFRTMVANAEELKESLRHLSIVPPPDFKIIDDPRITRVGAFLRRTSLDELPQLLNVLVGDMSLVGPRPTSFPASSYDLWHTRRLEVLPGLTGRWQVYGRNSADFDERLRLDIGYIENLSLRNDVALIARTVGEVFRRSGV